MTQSLPAHPSPPGSATTPADDPAPTGSSSARDRVLNAAAGVTLRTIPRIPDRLKRLLLGGRTITVDGNTLDTTLQLMLMAERASGTEGLIRSENLAIARKLVSITAAQFHRVEVDVTSTDVSVPGPAGEIPARHYGRTRTARRCWSSTTAADS